MTKISRLAVRTAIITITVGLMAIGTEPARAQAANPCAPKAANPCAPKAANPCAPKAANPCAPKAANPCAGKPEVDPKLVLRPKGTSLAQGNHAQLVKQGEALFKDTKLSTSGISCQSCHLDNDNFAPSFAKPYPHQVAMAKEKGGVASVQLDEMVQFCMVVPMAAKPLRWDSRELAALTAYSGELQKAFSKQPQKTGAKGANPCAAKNPCAPKK